MGRWLTIADQGEGKRRKYDREFKLEILLLINEHQRSVARIARDFGMAENTTYKQRKALQEDLVNTFLGMQHLKPEEETMWQLKRENIILREEQGLVKKHVITSQGHRDGLSVGIPTPLFIFG